MRSVWPSETSVNHSTRPYIAEGSSMHQKHSDTCLKSAVDPPFLPVLAHGVSYYFIRYTSISILLSQFPYTCFTIISLDSIFFKHFWSLASMLHAQPFSLSLISYCEGGWSVKMLKLLVQLFPLCSYHISCHRFNHFLQYSVTIKTLSLWYSRNITDKISPCSCAEKESK